MSSIGFIGTGRMGSALIESIAKSHGDVTIFAFDKNRGGLTNLAQKFGIFACNDTCEVVDKAEIIFLCVKPKDIDGVLEEIRDVTTASKLVVSIAAGISIPYIESKLQNARIARVMPNIACLVQEMAAGYALGQNVTNKDKKIIEELLRSAGIAVEIGEQDMDTVTALSGSGPAFISEIVRAMIDTAARRGLDKDIARKLACQTLIGTGRLLMDKSIDPDELVRMVASPGGTTEAGLRIMQGDKVRDIIERTVDEAANRSKELGKNG